MLTLLPKGVQKNNEKFSDLRFFLFATRVNDTGGVHLERRISPRIFEKFENVPNGIIRGWGKLIHVEPEVENLVAPLS